MDIQKIPPIHQKRIVTFVNYFIVDTVSFLNKFINSAEDSFWKLEKRMRKLETSLKLLEMKLNFIPDAQGTKEENKEPVSEEKSLEISPEIISQDENPIVDTSSTAEKEPEEIPDGLRKYYKMIQVGVPLEAVKSKMQLEGLDPNLLKSM